MKSLTQNQFWARLQSNEPEFLAAVRQMEDNAYRRGDGIAVYINCDLGDSFHGHEQYVTFGSDAAQIPGEPPTTMPNIGSSINWRYQLKAVYRPNDE